MKNLMQVSSFNMSTVVGTTINVTASDRATGAEGPSGPLKSTPPAVFIHKLSRLHSMLACKSQTTGSVLWVPSGYAVEGKRKIKSSRTIGESLLVTREQLKILLQKVLILGLPVNYVNGADFPGGRLVSTD
ncbi:hypothetical protein WG66_012824 [Moniliophthora roreri]|nr:hypothetical protein WG66_012824 [Moniliophthora roreri]